MAKQIVLWVIAVDFPLLYISAVSFESTALTITSLAVLAVTAAVAVVVY